MNVQEMFAYDHKEDFDNISRFSSTSDWSVANDKLNQDWMNFLKGRSPQYVRQPILSSWQRSSEANVDPYTFTYMSPPKEQIVEILEEEKELIDVSYSVMQRLLEFNPDGHVNLSNADGVALAYCGLDLTPVGSILNEMALGTNSTGRCLIENKLVFIASEENWKIGLRQRHQHCAAAPIRDISGELIGVLTLTCQQKHFNQYALGAVHTAAENISQRLAMKRLVNRQQLVLDTLNEGVIIADLNGTIRSSNRYLEKMFPETPMVGRHIDDVLHQENASLMGVEHCNYQEMTFSSTSRQPISCLTSVMKMQDGGRVISLRECISKDEADSKKKESKAMNTPYTFERIIGHSDALRETLNTAKICSTIDSTVLISGESGTGKELFAQAIHNASQRKNGPFIAINCGAIPKDLIQSELFGYVNGAYTGARSGGAPGKFELAHGGTIFLDEIGEMPLDAQTNLLRVIQEGAVVRIGASKPTKIDIRIIAATNKHLPELVSNSSFRQDLYYRLNVISLKIPSLRQRVEDIPSLVSFFTQRFCEKLNKVPVQYSPDAFRLLKSYSWPGNVRELENIVERLVSITSTLTIEVSDLPEEIIHKNNDYGDNNVQIANLDKEDLNLKSQEKTTIELAIQESGGNMRKSAEMLGISRSSLYLKIKKWNIDITKYRN